MKIFLLGLFLQMLTAPADAQSTMHPYGHYRSNNYGGYNDYCAGGYCGRMYDNGKRDFYRYGPRRSYKQDRLCTRAQPCYGDQGRKLRGWND